MSASQLSCRLSICDGRHRSFRLTSALSVLPFLLKFAPPRSKEAFHYLDLAKAEPMASSCREGHVSSIMCYGRVVAEHSLGPDLFLLAALGRRAKGKGICQETGSNVFRMRASFAKVPTFSFPSNSYRMQTELPFVKSPGL